MIRQYYPGRFRWHTFNIANRVKTVPVGTVETGAIFHNPLDGHRRYIVVGWQPREYAAARRTNGRWINAWIAGGHIAHIRRLHDGKQSAIADHHIIRSLED